MTSKSLHWMIAIELFYSTEKMFTTIAGRCFQRLYILSASTEWERERKRERKKHSLRTQSTEVQRTSFHFSFSLCSHSMMKNPCQRPWFCIFHLCVTVRNTHPLVLAETLFAGEFHLINHTNSHLPCLFCSPSFQFQIEKYIKTTPITKPKKSKKKIKNKNKQKSNAKCKSQ